MIFSLDVRRARKGDCLLVHYGTREKPALMLVDGGPDEVYVPHLRPRLMAIKAKRGLADDAPLPIDLLMVSHIDDDHIQGILDLTGELIAVGNAAAPPFRVRKMWHNTFDKIIGNDPEKLLSSVTASFGAAALTGEPDIDDERLDPSAAMVLAGVAQGFRLQADARNAHLGISLNPKLIMAEAGRGAQDMQNGLKFTVAGPMKDELAALQQEHDKWLKEQDEKRKKKEALAAFTDDSVANLSSIVVLAEVGDKGMLLTGDARGDKILEGLELVGRLDPDPDRPLKVNILKVPHHGSDRNMEPIFFKRVVADHYVFSGDGEHGNPERETLEMLFGVRGTEGYTMHFTYPIAEIDREREKDWKKEQAKEKNRKAAGRSKKEPRPDWSDEVNGLATLFRKHGVQEGRHYKVVGDQGAHVIDLLEPLGF
jgi:hypothetical protein